MTKQDFKQPPSHRASAFSCPHCWAYAHQHWFDGRGQPENGRIEQFSGVTFSRCTHCGKAAIWVDGRLIHPWESPVPPPNADLPDQIAADYREAGSILSRSPRGAAALLRLCIEKLCRHLGETDSTLNAAVAALVKKGLDRRVQRSLDVVRVIGNEAVHPGELNLRDDAAVAVQLATLVNLITDAMITQLRLVDELYETLPESKREAIENRDG